MSMNMNNVLMTNQQVEMRRTEGTMFKMIEPDGTISYIFRPTASLSPGPQFPSYNSFSEESWDSQSQPIVPMGEYNGHPYYVDTRSSYPGSYTGDFSSVSMDMNGGFQYIEEPQVSADFQAPPLELEMFDTNDYLVNSSMVANTIEIGSVEDFLLDAPFGTESDSSVSTDSSVSFQLEPFDELLDQVPEFDAWATAASAPLESNTYDQEFKAAFIPPGEMQDPSFNTNGNAADNELSSISDSTEFDSDCSDSDDEDWPVTMPDLLIQVPDTDPEEELLREMALEQQALEDIPFSDVSSQVSRASDSTWATPSTCSSSSLSPSPPPAPKPVRLERAISTASRRSGVRKAELRKPTRKMTENLARALST